MKTWYAQKGSMGQGIIADGDTGRTVAVAYDEKDAPLLAAVPDLFHGCEVALAAMESGPGTREEARIIRDAIRKAKGE